MAKVAKVAKKKIVAVPETETYEPYKGMNTKEIVDDLVKRQTKIENILLELVKIPDRAHEVDQRLDNIERVQIPNIIREMDMRTDNIDYLLEEIKKGNTFENNSFCYDKKKEQCRLDIYFKNINMYLDSLPIDQTVLNKVRKNLVESITLLKSEIDQYPRVSY